MLGDPLRGNAGNTCISDGIARITNVQFHHNMIRGDWGVNGGASGMYYSNGCTNIVNIYDNVFAREDSVSGTAMDAFIWTYTQDGNYSIYNNTFSSDSIPGYGAGAWEAIDLDGLTYGTHTIKNNIFSGFGIDIMVSSSGTATLVADYNLHNVSTVNGYGELIWTSSQYTTLSGAQAAGYEAHGLTGDPKFVAIPNGIVGSGNWQLQSSSPAIDKGVDLSTLFTTDLLGYTRQVPWDIGAYDYAADSGAPTYLLSVVAAHGTVTSSPSGISCADNAGTCSYSFISESVTLSQTPDSGYTFSSWSGTGVASGCSGTGTCVVTTSAIGTATATYTYTGGGATYLPWRIVAGSYNLLLDDGTNLLLDDGTKLLLDH